MLFRSRSPQAHAHLLRIDSTAALSAPGVIAVLTAEDLARDGVGAMACYAFPPVPPGAPSYRPLQPLLATHKVRHVGEPVAIVVAETLAQARDAAELIEIDYEPLPAVTLADALADGAPKVWDDAPDNLSFALERGDRAAVDAAFARAAHVTHLDLHYPRASANTLEPRTVFAQPDAQPGRHLLCSSAQSPHHVKEVVCALLGIAAPDLRVQAMDVGGGFGMKANVYPEEALVLWAALRTRRALKWTAEQIGRAHV